MHPSLPGLLIEFQEKIGLVAALYARIVPIFLIMPILNNSVLSSMLVRNTVIFAIILGLSPVIDMSAWSADITLLDSAILIGREAVVGFSLAFVMALPFWIFNAVGAFIDVARGSSMGSLIDPTSGQESTEMQNFLNFCICAMYMQLGGLKLLFETLLQSYKNVGFLTGFTINLDVIVPFLTQIFEHGFVLAAPVLLTLLLSECLLGLLSRFTPQLSAFSVSMTIKSVIAIAILSLYFWQIAPDRLSQLMVEYSQWNFVKGVN